MAIDHKDFVRLQEKRAKDKQAQNVTSLRVVEREAVDAEHLTTDPYWNKFLTYLEAARKRLMVLRDQAQGFMDDPRITSPDLLMQAKINFLMAKAQIDLLDAIVTMPKELITAGAMARDALEKFGKMDDVGPEAG